jgi:zinc-ribbon domain
MHCPNCGTKASAGQNFCRACGLSLDRFARLLAEETANIEENTVTHSKRRLIRLESGIKLARYAFILAVWFILASLIAVSGVNMMIDGNIVGGILALGIAVGLIAAEGLVIYFASLHAKTSPRQPARPTVPSAETTNKLQPEQQTQYAISVTEQTTARLGEKTEPRP